MAATPAHPCSTLSVLGGKTKPAMGQQRARRTQRKEKKAAGWTSRDGLMLAFCEPFIFSAIRTTRGTCSSHQAWCLCAALRCPALRCVALPVCARSEFPIPSHHKPPARPMPSQNPYSLAPSVVNASRFQ